MLVLTSSASLAHPRHPGELGAMRARRPAPTFGTRPIEAEALLQARCWPDHVHGVVEIVATDQQSYWLSTRLLIHPSSAQPAPAI